MREITRTVLLFLAGFVLVLLGSAFLAPWLASFLPFKFDRILRRLIMIGTLLLVGGVLWGRRRRLERIGLKWREGSLGFLGKGFFLGVALVGGMTLIQLAMGVRFWSIYETDGWRWIGFFFKAFASGIAVGAVEEFFFRGFLFLILKELWNTKGSLGVTNLIYAFVHFFPKAKPLPGPDPTVGDSFRLLGAVVPSFLEKPESFYAVLGLFLFGLILSFAFLRTGSLYLPIGIHAGAVFLVKLNRRFVPEISEKMGILSGSKNLYDGIMGIVLLGLFALVLGKSFRHSSEGISRGTKEGT